MGTMFARFHRALEDKTVGSVNADIGAESCAVGQDHLSSFTEIPKFPICYYTAKDSFFDQQFVHYKFQSSLLLSYIEMLFFQFYFAFSILPPPNAHMAWQ